MRRIIIGKKFLLGPLQKYWIKNGVLMDYLVSIIIVNYNGAQLLDSCISSIEKISSINYEIILVDNASKDESIEMVRNKFPKVKIISNVKNLGFAEGNNIGFKNSKGKYILLLNTDTTVEKDFLTPLLKEINNPKIGIVQPKILLMDDPTRLDAVGSFFTNTGFLFHYGLYEKGDNYNAKMMIYSAKGACMLIKREVIEKIGLFDDDFFAYFEETDFCHRVWLAGYEVWYVPESSIYHKGGATSQNFDYYFIQYHSTKNRICSYIKNLGTTEIIKVIPLHLLMVIVISFIYFLYGKPKLATALQRSIYWNIVNLPNTLQKRKHIQRGIRKLNGGEMMPKIRRTVGLKYFLDHYHLFKGVKRS